jgi:hypothetical protein
LGRFQPLPDDRFVEVLLTTLLAQRGQQLHEIPLGLPSRS